MSAKQPTIIYTLTDEAPLLATYASADHSDLYRAGGDQRRNQ
jgi:monomeric isocitrate dehydrogenase